MSHIINCCNFFYKSVYNKNTHETSGDTIQFPLNVKPTFLQNFCCTEMETLPGKL